MRTCIFGAYANSNYLDQTAGSHICYTSMYFTMYNDSVSVQRRRWLDLSQRMTKPTKWHVRPATTDQPRQPPTDQRKLGSLATQIKKAWVLSYPLSAERRLTRLGGCPGWSESSLGTYAILLVLSRASLVSFFLYASEAHFKMALLKWFFMRTTKVLIRPFVVRKYRKWSLKIENLLHFFAPKWSKD